MDGKCIPYVRTRERTQVLLWSGDSVKGFGELTANDIKEMFALIEDHQGLPVIPIQRRSLLRIWNAIGKSVVAE